MINVLNRALVGAPTCLKIAYVAASGTVTVGYR